MKEILDKKNFKTIDEANDYLLLAGFNIDEVINITNKHFKTDQLSLNEKDIALKKLELIIKALNDGWYPDWNNEDEKKYFIYFRMKGVFSYYSTVNDYIGTAVPSSLCLKSQLLAEYVSQNYLHLYEIIYK